MDNESESDADFAVGRDEEAAPPAARRTAATVVITENFISHELAAPKADKQPSL